jgi:peptidoglycan hydrolase-like protein with peptidoglycan-binding domain
MSGPAAAYKKNLATFALLVALVGGACSHAKPRITQQATAEVTRTTEETTSTVAPTTTLPKPSTTAAPPPPGVGRGMRGPEVLALEQRLADMHYDVGKVDGYFDSDTQFAVTAFQKVEGMKRSGWATPDVLDKVKTATAPPLMVPGGGTKHVEVDINRQVLFLVEGGALYRIIPVSTGSGARYCVDGDCAYAVTPGGSFRITWRVHGWHTSRLGQLYNPLFFNGGIAIHGALSVPAYPASHGCVRVPMSAAEWLPSHLPKDTPVYVLNGKIAPVPFDEPAPDGTPPSSVPTTVPPTTTTTRGFPFTTTTTAPSPTTTTTP